MGFSSPNPISISEIKAYCDLKGIVSMVERERLFRFIDVLDKEWMNFHHEEAKKADK